MKPIKRTRAVSHKNPTVNAATVKVEFANRKRSAKEISSSPTKSKNQKSTESSHASEIGVTNTSEENAVKIYVIESLYYMSYMSSEELYRF